ncbi:MAG TPA: DegT/DnrJ/EryC1/StrS family aminotransferase [Candidatus Gallimonas intestinavium]|uniref:DegT/DnrJ/EryC1/StrS family aminotransferase n=1 Tax=Candidatus Gallimonas intestinavium TaxID=2838603 RepID=A0A9D2JZZ1_9FIRM|nr:DegT/DnrJ/EryC1/StrS family aminotransferase [Candidatus Gallimonas intestinavium]
MEIKSFKKKIYLASPTMHGEELEYMKEAYDSNWMSTVGKNIDEVEHIAAQKAEVKYAVGLSCCTAALHLCVKAAGERLYGKPPISHGAVEGKRVFCSDMTFDATLNPVVYEGGIPVFIDTEAESWNMDPIALERAFELYPDTKLVVCAELYGFPGRIDLIKEICEKHGALLIEDAAEAMGATLQGRQCGSFGDYSAISYNGNKIITGSAGGCLLTNDIEVANRARKWSTQAREAVPWYQHEEVGYNYRMSNVIAGVIRGQYLHLEEHIAQKKAVYERYREGLKDLPVRMNPITDGTEPNYWLSAMIIDKDAMCKQVRDDSKALYISEKGKTCPTEILETLAKYNAEGRPIWKPMHMQPMYRMHEFVTREGSGRCRTNAYIAGGCADVGADIFERGLCLPSDNKMTPEEQDIVIEVISKCFE